MNDITYALDLTMNQSICKRHPMLKGADIYSHYLRKATMRNRHPSPYEQGEEWDPLYALTLVYNDYPN